MLPVVSIVGTAHSGKTTFLEKLIKELKKRGYRVATVKHTSHDVSFDKPGKDSFRHVRAGSVAAAVSTDKEFALIKPIDEIPTIDDIVHYFGDSYDILLTEGFKRGSAPKIEVHRKEVGPPLAGGLTELIAVLSDEPLDVSVPQYSLEDYTAIADMLEEQHIKPCRQRVTVFADDRLLTGVEDENELSEKIIALLAPYLNKAREIRRLDIYLRR
jgi:molybdopterin-guanine dinucleotide biosynthesis protein MobB